MNKNKRPPALNIFRDNAEMLLNLEPIELGNVMLAAVRYYLYDDLPKQLERTEQLVFSCLKSGIDSSAETYRERCLQRQKAAQKRWDESDN